MTYLHYRIEIQIPIPMWTARQMTTLNYVELYTLHEVGIRFQTQLPSAGMGLESGSESETGCVNV